MTPLQALQTTLSGEHAAIYLYGVIGGRVSAAAQPALASRVSHAYITHRGRRDQLIAMVRVAGADPVAAEVSYQLPARVTTSHQLTQAALGIERRCTEVYAQMVGNTSRVDRQWAIEALSGAALAQLGFGGDAQVFPGLPEL